MSKLRTARPHVGFQADWRIAGHIDADEHIRCGFDCSSVRTKLQEMFWILRKAFSFRQILRFYVAYSHSAILEQCHMIHATRIAFAEQHFFDD